MAFSLGPALPPSPGRTWLPGSLSYSAEHWERKARACPRPSWRRSLDGQQVGRPAHKGAAESLASQAGWGPRGAVVPSVAADCHLHVNKVIGVSGAQLGAGDHEP